jgi:hypothetical protein
MKTFGTILSILIIISNVNAQDSLSSSGIPFCRIFIGGGISSINPSSINNHISISNTLMESKTHTIKSAPEVAITFSIRPMKSNNQILTARAGYLWIERSYDVSTAETDNSPTINGYTTGKIKETYTAYPISIGAGMASAEVNPDAQLQIEFIYGFGYIKEEGYFTSSVGNKTSYSRTLSGTTYGLRFAGQTTIRFTNSIGLTLELGYRALKFDEFEDEFTTQPANIEFSLSGLFGNIGISISL